MIDGLFFSRWKMTQKRISGSRELRRTTFDFIDRLNKLENLDDVLQASSLAVHDFGFDSLALVDIPSSVSERPFQVLIDEVPVGWIDFYVSHDFSASDPILRWSANTTAPFEWTEARYDREQDHRAREVMDRADDFGMRHGFSLSVRHGEGSMNCFSMASSDRPALDHATKPALHLISTYAILRAHALREPAQRRPELTPREREILTWVAVGKTSSAVADILGLTERTVLAHVVNASRKLGASSRTHAVAKAVVLGLINI